ncbi:hypothetical protein LIER_08379 [Lithospermum erythrorhizon]|uniref:RNase H type-1 domain-containing protein n=1 Tax=Lithospermum erythrorhizon TaxID=34254 RepID=A0AAV3PFN1_LITER
MFITSQQDLLPYSFSLSHKCSNIVAEYQGLTLGLEPAADLNLPQLEIYGDSQLIIIRLTGEYEVRKPKLIPYHGWPSRFGLIISFLGEGNTIPVCEKWVILPMFMPHEYEEREIEAAVAITTGSGIHSDWRQPMIDYLQHGKLPDDVHKKIDIRRRVPLFVYFNDTLFRRSFGEDMLRCLSDTEIVQAMNEAD